MHQLTDASLTRQLLAQRMGENAVHRSHARNGLAKTSFCANAGWCFGTVHCKTWKNEGIFVNHLSQKVMCSKQGERRTVANFVVFLAMFAGISLFPVSVFFNFVLGGIAVEKSIDSLQRNLVAVSPKG